VNQSTAIYLFITYPVTPSGSMPTEHPMIRLIVNELARMSKEEVMASFQILTQPQRPEENH